MGLILAQHDFGHPAKSYVADGIPVAVALLDVHIHEVRQAHVKRRQVESLHNHLRELLAKKRVHQSEPAVTLAFDDSGLG